MKKLKVILMLVLALVMMTSFSVAFAATPYAVDGSSPFLTFGDFDGNSKVEKDASGSYVITQKTASPTMSRTLYGDDNTNSPYPVDMETFQMKFSVETLDMGGSFRIGFVNDINGYPMNNYGYGLGLLFADDGNYGFIMTSTIHPSNEVLGNYYLVYYNSQQRKEYRGKQITMTISRYDDANLLFNMYFDIDEGTNESAMVPFRFLIPVAKLGIDIHKAYMIITPNANNNHDMVLKVNDINEKNTNAYYEGLGGKTGNTINAINDYKQFISGKVNTYTAIQLRDFYGTKIELANMKGLRYSDDNERKSALAMDTSAVDNAAVLKASEIFADFNGEFVIDESNLSTAHKVLTYYNALKDKLTSYSLLAQKIENGIVFYEYADEINAIDNKIVELDSKYPEISGDEYLTALAEYNDIVNRVNSLYGPAKAQLKKVNLLNKFNEVKLVKGKQAYFVSDNTYFSNDCGQDTSNVRAARNADGSTSVVMQDLFGLSRLLYGTDIAAGQVDYKVNLEDFEMNMVIDDITDSGRFFVSFGADRTMYPYNEGGVHGLTIIFRMWSSVNQMGVNFTNTFDGTYANADNGLTPIGGLQDWGTAGYLTCNNGIIGKNISIKFKLNGENIDFSIAVEGGNTVTNSIPVGFFTSRKLDVKSLSMNFGAGEGGSTFNKGKDIKFTIKNIVDDYKRAVTALDGKIVDLTAIINGIVDKATLEEIDIKTFNKAYDGIDLSILRTFEKPVFTEKLNGLSENIAKVNQKAAKIVIQLIENTEDVNYTNISSAKENVKVIEEKYAILNADQKALVTDYDKFIKAEKKSIIDYETAKPVYDNIETIDYTVLTFLNLDKWINKSNEIAKQLETLSADQIALLSNIEKYNKLKKDIKDYNPESVDNNAIYAQEVIDIINKLDKDYAEINAENILKAKSDRDNANTKYNALKDVQKELVTNYSKIADVTAKIDDYEKQVKDYEVAQKFDALVIKAETDYNEITTTNLSAVELAVRSLKNKYEHMTEEQRAFVENYDRIAGIEIKIAEFKKAETERENKAKADAVKALIDAIGTVENTDTCKAKIDNAQAEYNKLNDEQKKLVTNYNKIAESLAEYNKLAESKGGCGSAIDQVSGVLMFVLCLTTAAVVMITRKKRA